MSFSGQGEIFRVRPERDIAEAMRPGGIQGGTLPVVKLAELDVLLRPVLELKANLLRVVAEGRLGFFRTIV